MVTHVMPAQTMRKNPCSTFVIGGALRCDEAAASSEEPAIDLHNVLGDMPVLKGVSEEAVARFAQSGELRRYMPKAEVFGPGAQPSGLFFAVEGCVQLVTPSADGRQRVAELFEAGAMFGEIGVLTQRPLQMRALATDPSVLIHVNSDTVRSALDSDIGLARRLLDSMACRTQRLIDSIGVSSSVSTVARVAAYLFDLAGSKQTNGAASLMLPAPKATIASMLNMNPESLSRSFRHMINLGVVSIRGRKIDVRDWVMLAGLAKRESG